MNKNDLMKQLSQEYLELSEMQKDKFSRIVNRLISINYLCGGRKKDREDYYFIESNERLFKTFLLLIDYEFYLKKVDLIVYIINKNNYNHLVINQLYSVVLLLLRKLYFQKSQDLQETEYINITLAELHAEIEATGLYEKRITKTELKDIYQFLSKYNICERIGNLDEDDTRLIIYPTINYILPVSKIEEITNRIRNYKRGDNNEDVNESEID